VAVLVLALVIAIAFIIFWALFKTLFLIGVGAVIGFGAGMLWGRFTGKDESEV
jgi:hypothetical protein